MPKYVVTTQEDGKTARSGPIEFQSEKAATDDAQIALSEMAREKLPDGAKADFRATVQDEAGNEIYRASLGFRAQDAEDIRQADALADEAVSDISAALRDGSGGPKESAMRTDIEPEGVPAEPSVHRVDQVTIHSVEQYEAATRRVQQLAGKDANSPEGAERSALLDAIMEWDKNHDDATGWR